MLWISSRRLYQHGRQITLFGLIHFSPLLYVPSISIEQSVSVSLEIVSQINCSFASVCMCMCVCVRAKMRNFLMFRPIHNLCVLPFLPISFPLLPRLNSNKKKPCVKSFGKHFHKYMSSDFEEYFFSFALCRPATSHWSAFEQPQIEFCQFRTWIFMRAMMFWVLLNA